MADPNLTPYKNKFMYLKNTFFTIIQMDVSEIRYLLRTKSATWCWNKSRVLMQNLLSGSYLELDNIISYFSSLNSHRT